MRLSDRAVGSAALGALASALAYYFAWLALPPFLAAPALWAFPERKWAVAVPAAGFSLVLAVVAAFVGCVLLREGEGGDGEDGRLPPRGGGGAPAAAPPPAAARAARAVEGRNRCP